MTYSIGLYYFRQCRKKQTNREIILGTQKLGKQLWLQDLEMAQANEFHEIGTFLVMGTEVFFAFGPCVCVRLTIFFFFEKYA